jgi:hypothetical protein
VLRGEQGGVCRYPENFRVDYALSREMQNKSGGKMYIQDKMEEYADELFDLLDNGADIYFCGLKGAPLSMYPSSFTWQLQLGILRLSGASPTLSCRAAHAWQAVMLCTRCV